MLDLSSCPNINVIVAVIEHAGIPRGTTCACLYALGFNVEQLQQLDKLLERPLPATFEEIRASLVELEPDLSASELDTLSHEAYNETWASYELRHTPDLTHVPAGVVDAHAVVPAIEDMCATYAVGDRAIYTAAVEQCLATVHALRAAQQAWGVATERLDAQDPARILRRAQALAHFASTMNTMQLLGLVNAVMRKSYDADEALFDDVGAGDE